jgi:hypothetical protein
VSEYVHGTPVCVTVNIWSAIVIVPVRLALPVFAATLKATDPLSVPEAPLVIVNHAALLTAVHGQPVSIRTETVPLPADDVNVWPLGVIDALQLPVNENVFEKSL